MNGDGVIGQFSKAVVQFEEVLFLSASLLRGSSQEQAKGVMVFDSAGNDSYHRPSPCAPHCRTSACSWRWFPCWPCGDARCGSGTSPMSSPSHPGGPSGSLKQTDGLRAVREVDGNSANSQC